MAISAMMIPDDRGAAWYQEGEFGVEKALGFKPTTVDLADAHLLRKIACHTHIDAAQDEERCQRYDETGQPGEQDHIAVEKADQHGTHERQRDGEPDIHAGFCGEQPHHQPGGAGHDPG